MRRVTILLILLTLAVIVLGGMFASGWQVIRWSVEIEIVIFDTEVLFAVLCFLTIFVMLFQVMTYEVNNLDALRKKEVEER